MQPRERDAKQRLECFCAHHPLLAVAGRDSRTGVGFVWVRTVKQERIMSEVVLMGPGTIQVRCRVCLRFHRITIRNEAPERAEVEPLTDDEMKVLTSNLK